MKSFKESILTDIEDTLKQGDEVIKIHNCLGKYLRFEMSVGSTASASIFSSVNLKKLTKNMSYIPGVQTSNKLYGTDKKDRVHMFANWFDHIQLYELGINGNNLKADFENNEFIDKLSDKLFELCKNNNIFNKPDDISLYIQRQWSLSGSLDGICICMYNISKRKSESTNFIKLIYNFAK
jgi:hypothetical protein